MFCPECGKEIETGAKFCSMCGKKVVAEIFEEPEQDSSLTSPTSNNTEENSIVDTPKKKKPGPIILMALITLAILAVVVSNVASTKYDAEYSNNSNTEYLPVTVEGISFYSFSSDSLVDVTFTVKNNINEPLKDCTFIVMGWDEDQCPVVVDQAQSIYWDYEYEYIDAYDIDVLKAGETQDLTFTFNSDFSNVYYISTFLVSCTDFDGESWENPIADTVIEIAADGCLLEDVDVYAFTLTSS